MNLSEHKIKILMKLAEYPHGKFVNPNVLSDLFLRQYYNMLPQWCEQLHKAGLLDKNKEKVYNYGMRWVNHYRINEEGRKVLQ